MSKANIHILQVLKEAVNTHVYGRTKANSPNDKMYLSTSFHWATSVLIHCTEKVKSIQIESDETYTRETLNIYPSADDTSFWYELRDAANLMIEAIEQEKEVVEVLTSDRDETKKLLA